jgi:tetratricopeptide (TPR) repeat protein
MPSPLPRLAAFAALAAAALAACTPTPRPSAATLPAAATRPQADAPLLGPEPTAGGIFTPAGGDKPLTGEALIRARMTRPQILDSVKKFTAGDLAATAAPATAPTTEPHEPPAQAVKYYLQGRSLFLEGSNTDAMDALEKSLLLDPESFTVLRLMGRVCFAASQLARGSVYLQRAYRLAPEDLETNYLLGRYWLERKDNDRAIFYLMNADRVKSRGEAQAPLISFHLGRALQYARYHAAAAATFEQFLAEASLPVAGYRYDRELSYLIEEQWTGDLSAAENFVLVGDYAKALPHYRKAAAAQPADPFIASRLVNAEAHSGTLAAAKKSALRFVTATKGSDDSLKLLVWTYRRAGDERTLINDVRTALGSAQDARQALVLAATFDALNRPTDAFDTLRAFAAKHPTDLDFLQRLFRRVRSAGQFDAALHVAAAALQAGPDATDPAGDSLLDRFAPLTASDAAAEWSAARHPPTADGYADYLSATTLVTNSGDPAAIAPLFASALDHAPDYLPARRGYVTWLLSRDQFAEAEALVNAAPSAAGPRAWDLRIELAIAREQLPQALAITQEALKQFPDDLDLHLRLAALHRARGEYADSDKELTALIDAHPANASAYEALISSLLERVRRPATAGGGQRVLGDAVAWLGRLTTAVPSSLFGQITTATLYAQVGRGEEAEAMMARLYQDHPDEPEVAIALARARQANGKSAEAAAGLEGALQARPSPALAAGLAQLYRTQGKPDDAAALVTRLAHEHPRVPGYAIVADNELNTQKKPEQGIALLQTAAATSPRSQTLHMLLARRLAAADRASEAVTMLQSFIARNGETTDRLYELSHLQSRVGNDADAETSLRKILAILPTHTGASNDLGFYWADAGKNLDEAEKLIKKALDAEPDNGAYLDSLGWVYYKQGRFPEAVTYLEKALRSPDGDSAEVIVHVADALYRAGRAAEAAERWRQAQTLLASEDEPLPKEEQQLKAYLEKVLTAVTAGKTPDVTPTAQSTPPRAATR